MSAGDSHAIRTSLARQTCAVYVVPSSVRISYSLASPDFQEAGKAGCFRMRSAFVTGHSVTLVRGRQALPAPGGLALITANSVLLSCNDCQIPLASGFSRSPVCDLESLADLKGFTPARSHRTSRFASPAASPAAAVPARRAECRAVAPRLTDPTAMQTADWPR